MIGPPPEDTPFNPMSFYPQPRDNEMRHVADEGARHDRRERVREMAADNTFNSMKWYYKVQGIHTRVRVFMNGANCGELCFRNEEFQMIQSSAGIRNTVIFINETPPPAGGSGGENL